MKNSRALGTIEIPRVDSLKRSGCWRRLRLRILLPLDGGRPVRAQSKDQDGGARLYYRHPYLSPSPSRLCRNHENAVFVILNEVKNLMHSMRYTTQILRLTPQNDIATQSLEGEDGKSRNVPDSRLVAAVFLDRSLLFFTDASAPSQKSQIVRARVGIGDYACLCRKRARLFRPGRIGPRCSRGAGQICTMALLNGQMELSSNPNIFDAMVAGRFKGKVIYVSAKTLGHRFIVAPEIKSFDGLKQKNIAVSTFGGLTDMLTREILEQHGINPAKNVVLLQIGTPDVRYASLKAGTVRAALLASTQGLQAVKEGFRELPYQQPPWLSSPIVAGDELLARDRSMLRSLLRAVDKGHLYYGQNGPRRSLSFRRSSASITG